mgnify:CR=1 FL=1
MPLPRQAPPGSTHALGIVVDLRPLALQFGRWRGKQVAKTGRNEPCPCGSGEKYKKCCQGTEPGGTRNRLLLLAVGVAALVAILAGFGSVTSEKSSAGGRIWSAEHGHYHDANGVATP